MRRGFGVGLVVVALLAVAPAAGAKDGGAVEAIRDAYAQIVDQSLPLRERLEALEDGEELRDTIKKLDSGGSLAGVSFRSVQLHVQSARVHGGNAEVQLTVFVDMYMVTSWTGVARKIDGRWVVAQDTVCTLLGEWTELKCPGDRRRYVYAPGPFASVDLRDGDAVIPMTFADGGRADLVVPNDLDGNWEIRPHASLLLDGKAIPVYFSTVRVRASQLVRRYEGVELDAMMGLLFDLDGWTASVPAEELSEHERRLVARHVAGYTTKTNYPVLTPTGPLAFREVEVPKAAGVQLVKSALFVDERANPMELWYGEGDGLVALVVVTPGPCPSEVQRPQISEGYRAEERCADNGFGRIAVEGTGDLIPRLLDELRIEHYRPAPKTASV